MTPQRYDHDDLLDRFDIGSLAAGAARLRPDQPALIGTRDGVEWRLSFADLDRRATALANRFDDLSIEPGECALLMGGASADTIIAIIAALRAGLDLALAPLHLTPGELAGLARETKAVALCGDAVCGEISPVETLFSVAAMASDVRLVCSLGPDEVDGAVQLDSSIAFDRVEDRMRGQGARAPRLITLDENGRARAHRQQTLVASALDLATRARIGADFPILTTHAPVTFAGLVAGPVVSLLTGAALIAHGPFDAQTFLAEIGTHRPVHLIATGAIAGALDEAGLLHASRIRTLLALTRMSRDGDALAPALQQKDQSSRIVDLYAFDESCLIAEPRDADGTAVAPADQPHMIAIDDRALLAAKRAEDGSFEGLAVTPAES